MLGNRFVLIRHPHQEGFVSLRASAANADGGTVEQAILQAYRIR